MPKREIEIGDLPWRTAIVIFMLVLLLWTAWHWLVR